MEPYCDSNPNNALKGPAWAQGEIKLGFGPSFYALYHILSELFFPLLHHFKVQLQHTA